MNKLSQIPEYLPKKLSIDSWIWSWITAATAHEPYADLEKCVLEAEARGFNTIRIEAGLNWAFTIDGQPRGSMYFGPWIAGYGWNASTVDVIGGGRHDVLERVLHLFELAHKHDLWVILTSWEYEDSSWYVADQSIRDEVYAVLPERRLMHLAEQLDRLLKILKSRGLAKNIAFAEIHNEPDASEIPKA